MILMRVFPEIWFMDAEESFSSSEISSDED